MSKYQQLIANVGKEARITYSEIAGLKGKTGIIRDVKGNDRVGYRYAVELSEDHFLLVNKTFYPPTYFCDIIEDENNPNS